MSRRAGSGPISKRISAVDQAIEALGRERIKPGPIRIGKSPRVTLTTRGFRSLERTVFKPIRDARGRFAKTPGSTKTFSYKLTITTKTGRVIRESDVRQTVVRDRELRAAKARGLGPAQAMRSAIEKQMHVEIGRAMREARIDTPEGYRTRLKTSRAKAQEYLRQFLSRKGVRVQMELYREV